ncbi:MAG: restriction endonuclease subunit S [Pseudomonadota bacterium]|nr:restriction endonuclease subunit S [Pseudomonadota bacterium]MDP1905768.1 restriction endonuclease subunit S [Pseudomonadota bacterium]MDP2352007.1 restriction endonuclease subunit S [Pseudomonadota bacterium]
MKPGYKQTEVGVIPEEWEVRPLSLVAEIRGGIAKNSNVEPADPISVHYLRVANVQDGYLDLAEMSKIQLSRHDLNRYRVLPGDVLMNEGGDLDKLGRGAIWNGEFNPCVNQNHVFVVRCKSVLLPEYLNVWTATKSSRRFFLFAGKQTTNLASISKSSLGELPVAVPALPEQRAIAAALSDVDALLGGLERLIAKKRDLKQAAIQQLLTGQTRLPGFSGEWEEKRLGDVGIFLKGSGVRKDEAQSGGLPCVRYGEIYTHHNDYIKQFNSWISVEVAASATRLKQGDLLFAGSGETKEEIGKCVAFVNNCEAYAGGDTVILRPAGANSMFMGYYCNTAPINAQKASKGQGDAVVHISAAALSSIMVILPSLPEQTAIATVLSDMDAELAALEARRDKTRALKQAMMQELLTGRIRLL